MALLIGACAARQNHAVTAQASGVVLASASIEGDPTPATRPALPAGHPSIDALAPSTQPALPKGHPDISQLIGGGGAGGQLPAGHPDISKMTPGDKNAPKMASVTVKAEQGTIGGPAIGAEDVTVEVLAGDQVVGKLDTKLNEKGTVTISGLPVGAIYQPQVTVKHAGVMYQAAGNPIDGATQTINVKVYETTDKPVDWEVRMRHIMLQPSAAGVQVMDMIAVDNATDRAYVGTAAADGSRKAFEIPLPAGATDVQFSGGFHDCCTKIENGKVINSMAIVPGTTQYQLVYNVPQRDGKAEITTASPAPTKHLIVFAPDDGTTITAAGLETGTTKMGESNVRFFKGNSVPAGQIVTLTVSGTPRTAPVKSSSASGVSQLDVASLSRAVAGIGAVLVFLIGGMMVLRKASSKPTRA